MNPSILDLRAASQAEHASPDRLDEDFREQIVSAMLLCVQYWQQATLKTKLDLAMESGIWTANRDGSTLVTRTLDKYLRLSTLPKRPHTEEVFRTLHYVLNNCDNHSALREQLEALTDQLIIAHHQLSLLS